MKKIILTLLLAIGLTATAQEAANNGFLPSRVTTAVRDAFTNPAKGLIVFNTDKNTLEINSGTGPAPVWHEVANGQKFYDLINSGDNTTVIAASATSHITTTTLLLPAGTYSYKGNIHLSQTSADNNGTGSNDKLTWAIYDAANVQLSVRSSDFAPSAGAGHNFWNTFYGHFTITAPTTVHLACAYNYWGSTYKVTCAGQEAYQIMFIKD